MSEADMAGKVVVITGANAGIGKETTRRLAAMDARIVMACRDVERGLAARREIRKDVPDADLSVMRLDLSDAESIADFVAGLGTHAPRVDVLINNAGVYAATRKETAEGLEMMFAVNHLGTFRLTTALLPLLERSAPSRIATLSSIGHHWGRVHWDDLQMERRKFNAAVQYGTTKLMNLWFSDELARRLEGTGVTSNAVHPGSGSTSLTRDFSGGFNRLWKFFFKDVKTLAKTSVHLASAPDLEGRTGGYYHMERQAHRARQGRDAEGARRLWDLSEEMA